jgi:hypothetical protein
MTVVVEINRPWFSSFSFKQAAFSMNKLEQVHKLSRNFVCSLDLGCPSAKHVKAPGTTPGMSQRELYKVWVSDWKRIYNEVSGLIRTLKTYRRTARFPVLTPEQQALFVAENKGTNQEAPAYLHSLASYQLARLQETAQVLLNARYNAKLAAAEARRRTIAERSSTPVAAAA